MSELSDKERIKQLEAQLEKMTFVAVDCRQAVQRMSDLVSRAADHWMELQNTYPVKWEGAIDDAMAAACREIKQRTELLRPFVLFFEFHSKPRSTFSILDPMAEAFVITEQDMRLARRALDGKPIDYEAEADKA